VQEVNKPSMSACANCAPKLGERCNMSEKSQAYKALVQIMDKHPNVRLGIADIGYSEYSGQYSHALVFAIPHGKIITLENYSEQEFDNIISAAQLEATEVIATVTAYLEVQEIAYLVPPLAQTDEKYLLAPFSFKFAAVNAGLGWIGKNGVLITQEYGPRVRLSAVLVNHPLPAGKPIRKSLCAEDCFRCVDACPFNALKGIQWNIHRQREEIIDYQLCNFKRSRYLKEHGRKNACGLCMAACPLGIRK
jgi:epoxyqueuosine reductase